MKFNNQQQYLSKWLLLLFLLVIHLNVLQQLSIWIYKTHLIAGNKTSLCFTPQQWQKMCTADNDEIDIDGNLFDIVSIKKTNNQVIIFGEWDEEEDDLLALEKESNKQLTTKKSDFSFWCVVPQEYIQIAFANTYFLEHNDGYTLGFSYHIVDVEIPPPNFI